MPPTSTPRQTRKRERDANENATGELSAPRPVNGQAGSQAKAPQPPTATFWEFIFGLGERWQREGLFLYIYRLWPVCDQRNPERFLCKLSQPIDEDYLLKHFGSGKYWLLLNDGQGKNLRKHVANPHNPDFPPRVSPQEVIESDPQNKLYFEVWKKLTETPAAAHQPSSQSDMNTVLTTVLEKTGSFDPKLADLWEKTTKERDELARALAAKNAPPDLLEVAKNLKELFPTQPAPSEKVDVLALVAALKGMQPPPQDPLAVLQQAKDLFAPENPSERSNDEIARLDQILGFAQKLAQIRAPAGNRNAWDVGLDFARELGTPIFNLLNNVLLLRSQSNGVPRPAGMPPATTAPPSSFDPYANPEALRQYARTMNAQAPATPGQGPVNPAAFSQHAAAQSPASSGMAQPSAAPAESATASNELMLLLQSYGGLIVSALNNGTPGYDFADNVARLFGSATHAMIANCGEESLSQNMLAVPELAIFGESRVRKFAREFVHYEELLDQLEEGEEDAAGSERASA